MVGDHPLEIRTISPLNIPIIKIDAVIRAVLRSLNGLTIEIPPVGIIDSPIDNIPIRGTVAVLHYKDSVRALTGQHGVQPGKEQGRIAMTQVKIRADEAE